MAQKLEDAVAKIVPFNEKADVAYKYMFSYKYGR